MIHIITTMVVAPTAASEALVMDAAKALARKGQAVDVTASCHLAGSEWASQMRALGVVVRHRGRLEVPPWGGRLLGAAWRRALEPRLLAAGIRRDTKLVVMNCGSLSEVASVPWSSYLHACKRPYVLIVHNNPEIREYRGEAARRLRCALAKATRVYFVSERLRDNAEEQLVLRIPHARVIRNPVNLAATHAEPWPEIASPLRLAVVGRLTYQKGQIRLLHALAMPHWRARDWELRIFGDGDDREQIEQAIDFYGLRDRVTLCGHVSDIRQQIWTHHHALVMPSMYEGMPLTLVEAMICGRVAVCSDVGGAAELIEDGVNGFLAGSPFARQLDLALGRLWDARDRLPEMARRAHESALRFLPVDAGDTLASELLHVIENG